MLHQELDELLEEAFLEGHSSFITNLPYEASDDPLLEIVAQKIADTLNLCLDSLDKNEAIVKNVLVILKDFSQILINNLEQSIVITECMLRIATEEIVPLNILKCAVSNLNVLLKGNGSVLNWLQNEESLEGFLLILGRRLPSVGDFECQTNIFETLCYIINDNESKPKWIQSWFTDDEKTRSMFLNWNLENFTLESRKILNQINNRELNPRTYAVAATAVYFGNVQLRKLNGLEFWIDFNYDSRSISFFCSDFEDQDTSAHWESVTISSDDVKCYSVEKKRDNRYIELCITLNSSCRELTMSLNPAFETNLVHMIFCIYLDISSHLRVLFGEPVILADDQALISQKSQGSQSSRKVSVSVDALKIQNQDKTVAARKIRKISASDVVKIYEEDNCNLKERRISESAVIPLSSDVLICENYGDLKKRRISDSTLIPLSDDTNNFGNDHKTHDSSPKSKLSCCSLLLKESVGGNSFKINEQSKYAKFKDVKNLDVESQVFRTMRKSSDASCTIGYRSDDSDCLIIDTKDGERSLEKITENVLKEKHKVHKKYLDSVQAKSKAIIENKIEQVDNLESHKFDQDVRFEESIVNSLAEKSSQTYKTETNLSFKDSQKRRNSNESKKLSQKNKKSISSDGNYRSATKAKEVPDASKVSLEEPDDEYESKIILENDFVERDAPDVKLMNQNTRENELHLFDKDVADSESRKGKSKKNSNSVGRKSPTNRLLKRKAHDVEKEVISSEMPLKKQRKAAIRAMEKNKTILKEKGAETEGVTDTSDEKTDKVYHSDDEIEEVFTTPPTKPVKKRKLRHVFLTDTETGSSNVSWFGEKHSGLFETPQKSYSMRRKSKQLSKSPSRKKKTRKSSEGNSKRKRKSNFSMSNFEIKSKTGLSDLENYELVVEPKTDHAKSSSFKTFTSKVVSKAIKAALESCVGKQNFDDQHDNEPNNINFESIMNDNIPEFSLDKELYKNESVVKKNFITPERHVKNPNSDDLRSNISDQSNVVEAKTKHMSFQEKLSNSNKSLFQEKDIAYDPKLYKKTECNVLKQNNSATKRKQSYHSASKEKVKRYQKDSDSAQSINLDAVFPINDTLPTQGLTSDEISSNIPSAFKAQNTVSSKSLEKEQSSFSCISEKTTENHLHHGESLKMGILNEQSLSSLENDEERSKESHIQTFLKGLPGKFDSPNNFQHTDNFDQDFTLFSYKASKSNKSSRSSNSLKQAISENCLSEENKMSGLSSAKNYKDIKKRQLTIFHLLGIETDLMTHKLLKTLQKHFHEYNIKIISTREKILSTASALISKENEWGRKDLKNIAKVYKANRIRAEKSLKKILLVGQEYFEAEDILNQKMKRLHRKALRKYESRVKLAGSYAVKALEDRAATKTETLLKSILNKIEQI